ncbi:PH domain-containing protein [Sediminihabitans luteus]|nr:PH domain-containing protein [Sediminihabitans luteus]
MPTDRATPSGVVAQDAVPKGATADPAAGLDWRRVHPVTPLVRGWAVLVAVLVVVGQQSFGGVVSGDGLDLTRYWVQVLLGVVVLLLGALGISALAWRKTSFAIDDDSVHLRTGILFKQQRNARLTRLQAVDLNQPLLGRLVGLAELRLEVAGGADSAVRIGFLRLADAEQLRNEILARAAGVARRPDAAAGVPGHPANDGAGHASSAGHAPSVATGPGEAPADPTGADAAMVDAATADAVTVEAATAGAAASTPATPAGTPGLVPGTPAHGLGLAVEAPERPVLELAPGRLVWSLVRSLPFVAFVVGVAALVGVAIGTRDLSIAYAALPAALGAGGFLFSRFSGEFGFRSAISPDGVRLRHGLLESRAQTIPPGRVQAVQLHQGMLWRDRDWWRVEVNVAGYGVTSESSSVLLPVGTRDEALTALWLVLPDLGDAHAREVLDEALVGSGPGERFTTAPRRARWLDPWAWQRQGFAVTGTALLLRRGRFVRSTVVVPHERTQSLGLDQGPLQRRLGVASFAVHSTPGPVSPSVAHLDERDAAALIDAQAARARRAREHAGPEQWMRSVLAVVGDES